MLSFILILAIAGVHFYFTYLEAFVWDTPRTRAIFGISAALAPQTKAMAANQGAYNAFIGAGLVYGLLAGNGGMVGFLLLCVVVAGLVAAATGVTKALYAQTAPAVVALLLRLIGI